MLRSYSTSAFRPSLTKLTHTSNGIPSPELNARVVRDWEARRDLSRITEVSKGNPKRLRRANEEHELAIQCTAYATNSLWIHTYIIILSEVIYHIYGTLSVTAAQN
eukprot:m.224323 g.224323  ORF g.224323 m.224323 type:complete len:106 (-) comp15950_c0_seq6:2762-3079(-)